LVGGFQSIAHEAKTNGEQLRLLRDSGFQGPICVESPRNGDRLTFVRRDVAYLNDLMHDLGMR